MDIKEYIYTINNRVYLAYGFDEQDAKKRFIKACSEHSKTDNEHYKNYWTNMVNSLIYEEYTCIENTNFMCVREVL